MKQNSVEQQKENLLKLQDLLESMGNGLTKEEFVKSFENIVTLVLKIRKEFVEKSSALDTQFSDLTSELQNANSIDIEEVKTKANDVINAAVMSMIEQYKKRIGAIEDSVQNYTKNRDTDRTTLMQELSALVPKVLPPETPESVRDKLESLRGENRLDISAIRGMEELQKEIKDAQANGKEVRVYGSRVGMMVYIGGVKKGVINNFNLVGGIGIAIAYSKVDGQDTLTFNATGSGLTVETPPEVPNSVIVSFTVSAQPKWVVADGTTFYENAGYTYSSGTGKITMANPPSSFIRDII